VTLPFGNVLEYWNANGQLRMWLYIVYKFGDVWCSVSRETFAYFCAFVKKIAKMGISGRV